MICARFSVPKRFVLTIMLERSAGERELVIGNRAFFPKAGRYAVDMPSVHDVASYILHKQGRMSTWKLQKLVYYSQAWSLVWDDEPLFKAKIEAWANGPVVRTLYERHRGAYAVSEWRHGDRRRLSKDQRETVDLVLDDYGKLTGRQLSQLTHAERPWREARQGLTPTDYGDHEITLESMQTYYEALDADDSMPAVADIDWASVEAS
jgi:uncharacterized phage-associated protein